MRCGACGHENRAEARFCDGCGSALARRCPTCRTEVRVQARFCDSCGASLAMQVETAEPATTDAAGQSQRHSQPLRHEIGERRHLTVMFCDLIDSSHMAERLDPEDLAHVLRQYHELCGHVVSSHDGHVARIVGDGLFIYFGYPRPHEDAVRRAVRAGLGIVHALAGLDERLEQEHGLRLRVRIGIHTGLVVLGEMRSGDQYDPAAVTGETPNIAARVQALAPPNAVVISQATHRLAAGYFATADMGEQFLKGVSRSMQIYQVLAESGARSRLEVVGAAGLTPLVGRQHELALLQDRWAQARDGLGQVVVLVGEAGIGKSRLTRALQDHVAQDPRAWLTPLQCSAYHQHSALYPWVDLIERIALPFESDEPPAQRLRKLEGWLAAYGMPLQETVPLFAALLSLPPDCYVRLDMSPQQQRRRTLETLLALLGRLAMRQPVLLTVEDLHWSDPTTLELLDLIVEQAPTISLLALFTCRPEITLPWTGRAHVGQVNLTRLPKTQTETLVERVTGGRPLPKAVRDQIVSKTDGVPLFVEELTKTVLESGLVSETQGRFELTGPLPPLGIPATLHDSLLARLGRLDDVKEVAQLGATIGREFGFELLSATAGAAGLDETALRDGLARLIGAELVYQRGVPPQATYVFKHVLVRDAAYESLLRSRRQQFHRLIAETLERRFPQTVDAAPEIVAHHYAESGLTELALVYWRRAGERALARSAYAEAEAHLRKAIGALGSPADDVARAEQELALQVALGNALMALHGYAAPVVEAVYLRAQDLATKIGRPDDLYPVLYGLFAFYVVGAQHARALATSQEFLALALREKHPAVVVAQRSVGVTLLYMGELEAAETHFVAVEGTYDPRMHRDLAFRYAHDPLAAARAFGAWTLWLLGRTERAQRWADEAVALARERGYLLTLAYVHCFTAMYHHSRRDVDSVVTSARAGIVIAVEHGMPMYEGYMRVSLGWGLAQCGQVAEGLIEVRRGMAAVEATGARFFGAYQLGVLAEVSWMAGHVDAAFDALDGALEFILATGERYWLAEVHRMRGELLLEARPGEVEAAAACFEQALLVARAQRARSLELRAALSLANLRLRQNRATDARALLRAARNTFPETAESPDLVEVDRILTKLA